MMLPISASPRSFLATKCIEILSIHSRQNSILGNVLLASTISALLVWSAAAPAATVTEQNAKMGSRFEITVVHATQKSAHEAIDAGWAEIDRVEKMISSWSEDSETSAINNAAGSAPVKVSQELFNLIRRSLRVSQLTNGAFDITFDTVGRHWNFKNQQAVLPDKQTIESALRDTGHRHVIINADARTVYLDRPNTRIGFGAIGKGFAANRTVFVLRENGVTGGIVNAGGDLVIFGQQEDGTPWRTGIADPLNRETIFAYLDLTEQAVVTSGDYESFIEIDGKRYSHILDPRTGYPVQELRSVTIVCPDGELADALATGISVMGISEGLALLNRLEGIEGMLVDKDGRLHFSKNLRHMLNKDHQ